MVLIILLATSVVVGGLIATLAGMKGRAALGPIAAMCAAMLAFYGVISLV
jgi:hypothetical protein